MIRALFLLLLLATCPQVLSQISLPRIVRDSMILQRDTKVKIWGWASPKEKVTVTFNKKKYQTTTTLEGKWAISLDPIPAGGPFDMEIKGKNTLITLKDILFGDVWLCSGQSNMVHQMNIHDVLYEKEIASANYPAIRQFWVPTLTSLSGPADNLPAGEWKAAVGEDLRPFSAVAFFFAKKLYHEYKIPIGIINASVGGTPIEAWISEEGFKDFPQIQKTILNNKDTAFVNNSNRRPPSSNRTTLPSSDKGISGPIKWYENDYVPQNWKNIAVPGYWEDQGIKDLNGVVWYRKEISVPNSMIGKKGRLFLGRIVDADVVYINGKQIGNATYMYPQRRYAIPSDLLTPGKNTITVKVTNNGGKGGFVPDKPYYLFVEKDTIDLTGYWQYRVGEVFIPRTGGGFGGGGINAQNQPTALYNRMVAPYTDYEIKGVLWYQGESNTGKPADYLSLQAAQIKDWRQKFRQPNLPFYFVQLPNFMDANYIPSESQWAQFRESQLKTLSIQNTGMAVIIDLGEWNDIHPDNKKDVGERLALIAQNKLYGKVNVYSGPIFKSATFENEKILLSFDHIGGGLISKDGEDLREFAIAGEDKKFVWAKTKIQGDKIVVWSDQIPNPKYVRYAWADNPDVNLYNKEGLPASPFRTDN